MKKLAAGWTFFEKQKQQQKKPVKFGDCAHDLYSSHRHDASTVRSHYPITGKRRTLSFKFLNLAGGSQSRSKILLKFWLRL